MLHLARKAFFPAPLPFPLLHVDTTWKFKEMIAFRDKVAAEPDIRLIVHQNPDCISQNINPFDHGSSLHTDMWKTQGLKQALDVGGFDLAFGGARRDEEKSRAKERVFFHFAPRIMCGILKIKDRNSGTCTTHATREVSRSEFSRYQTGPNSMCGSTS